MTLNEAIYQVISTQYKKDAQDAHKKVIAAGYEIDKKAGCFRVINHKTARIIEYGNFYQAGYIYLYGTKGTRRYSDSKRDKIDFAGYLDKPINKAYTEYLDYIYNRTESTRRARKAYNEIHTKKYCIKNAAERIEGIKKQIAALQNDLIWEAGNKARMESDLYNIRRAYKLA